MDNFYFYIDNETLIEIKTSLDNLWQRTIQLSDFYQYSLMLIPKRKCLVGDSRIRCGESGTPRTIIYTRWIMRDLVPCSYAPDGVWPTPSAVMLTILTKFPPICFPRLFKMADEISWNPWAIRVQRLWNLYSWRWSSWECFGYHWPFNVRKQAGLS